MNKLDSILSKLLIQNAAANQCANGDRSRVASNGDQKSKIDQSPKIEIIDEASLRSERISPSGRVNKRKNFTPKVVRSCDDRWVGEKEGESSEIVGECSSPLSSDEGESVEGRKRIRYMARNSADDDDDDDSNRDFTDIVIRTESGLRNGRQLRDDDDDEDEDDVQTPGLLAIVEPDDDVGASGRSSSNRSNSIFASGGMASSSVSPSLLLNAVTNAFNNVNRCRSPSSIVANASPAATTSSNNNNNRYSNQRVIDSESKQNSTASQSGSTSTNQRHEQQAPFVSYIVRFMGNDCGAEQCRFSSSREHFHCKLCNNKLFTKKEEMLRHYKWHRKREESLAYGFMRYSASDDCSHHFADCVHNLRQTHYHCLQDSCDKVYISTSDVQMHANSHRKQAHIAKEGFQRVKGSEQCAYAGCPFTDPSNRTTHFHCLRPGCSHSFKNKADMDKHKAHHTRDEQLTRDGFKKYMKSEACSFAGCAFSKIVNHIHCIRPGCDYVLHSTSQMYSHKRKHEKQDKRVNDYVAQQQAIANAFKNANALMAAAGASASFSSSSSSPSSPNAATIVHHHFTTDAGHPPLQFSMAPTPRNGIAVNSIDRGELSFSPPVAKKVATTLGNVVQNRLKLKQYDPYARTFHDAGTLDPNQKNAEVKISTENDKKATSLNLKKEEIFDPDDVAAMGIDMSTLQSPIQFLKSVTKSGADSEMESENDAISGLSPMTASAGDGIFGQTRQLQQQQQTANGRSKGDDSWKKFITRYTANDPCVPLCPLLYKDHYHCTAGEGCKMTFKSKDGVRDHAKQHEQLCLAIEQFRVCEIDEDCKIDECPFVFKELHYHCLWTNCSETIGSSEPVFRRLEHHKVHEYSTQLMNDSRNQSLFASAGSVGVGAAARSSNADILVTSISPAQTPTSSQNSSTSCNNDVFKRKRGRPPKYNVLDVNVNPSTHVGQSPEIMLTSFKLPKTTGTGTPNSAIAGQLQFQQQQQQQQPEAQTSPTSQSRRGRPRTVSSPRHQPNFTDDMAAAVNQTAATVAILQRHQAHQLQQQLELLRMWNNSFDAAVTSANAVTSPSSNDSRLDQATSTKRPQFDGFTTYMATENCPDTLCRYRCQLHYHCRLPRCFYNSNRGDQLETHHRDFHDAFEIPDGYACYDRSYNCRHVSCQYNGQARHFHCQKAGCSAALLKFNELTAHSSKGHDALQHEQQFGSPAQNSASPDSFDHGGVVGARNQKLLSNNVVRTSGIFYPATSIGNRQMHQHTAGGGILSSASSFQHQPTSSSALTLNPATFAALAQSLSPAFALFNAAAALGVGGGSTSTPQIHNGGGTNVAASGTALPYTVEQQCGRPFCKLKRRLHYHCTLCHQGFSHFDRLAVHMQKHGVVLPPLLAQQPPICSPAILPQLHKNLAQANVDNQQRLIAASKPLPPPPSQKDNNETKSAKSNQSITDRKGAVSPTSAARASAGQKKVKFHVFQPKMMKFSDSNANSLDSVAETVKKVAGAATLSSTVDATPPSTQNKPSVKGANKNSNPKSTAGTSGTISGNLVQFKFVDCTVDVSNANRGGTISQSPNLPSTPKQESISISSSISPTSNSESTTTWKKPSACSDDLCERRLKSDVHYHCEKCEFWTPESTKWHVHAKQHSRMDQVTALGFRKVVAAGGNCGDTSKNGNSSPIANCPLSIDCLSANQSHYHCMTCNFIAFNQSQMSAHKTTKHPD